MTDDWLWRLCRLEELPQSVGNSLTVRLGVIHQGVYSRYAVFLDGDFAQTTNNKAEAILPKFQAD